MRSLVFDCVPEFFRPFFLKRIRCMKLARRTILAAAAALATLGLSTAQAAPREIKLGYALGANSHFGAAAKAWAEKIDKDAGGTLMVKHFGSSALGGERELVEGLQLGTVEAAILSTGTLSNFVPDVGVVDIPFLFRDTAHARAVLDGAIGRDILAKFERRGLVALAWGEQGFRHLTNNKVAVKTVADLKGLKIRVTENPTHITAWRALGAAPTPMAWPEVIGALQQGTIDGQENPVSVITSAKLWEVQKHLSLTAHVYAPMVLAVSASTWGSLSPEQRKVLTEGARAGGLASRAFVDDVEKRGVQQAQDAGMQIERPDTTPFREALASAYKEYAKKFGQKQLDAIAAVRP